MALALRAIFICGDAFLPYPKDSAIPWDSEFVTNGWRAVRGTIPAHDRAVAVSSRLLRQKAKMMNTVHEIWKFAPKLEETTLWPS